MASPFAVFRRNQKMMLATVGILAIIAFVFLTPLMQIIGGPARPVNPVVVETNYGDFTRQELENLEFSRQIVDRFLRNVTTQMVANQVGQGNLDARLFDSLADQQYRMQRQQLMGRSEFDPEKAAIETLVLSKRAEQMGMVISDQAINDLLKQLTADSVTPAQLEEIIRGLQPSRPISVARLFDALRIEMLASQYSQLFVQSLRDVTPAQRFEYYSRLNRRASAEVMPLAVADFVGQVGDPSDEEVKQFYNKYKYDFPNPESPEPGFKEPRRATFQYFMADVGRLTEKIEPEITEEEIAASYEKNKEQFRVFSFDDEQPKTEEPAEEGEKREAAADDEKPTAEPNPTDQPQPGDPQDAKPGEPAPDDNQPNDEDNSGEPNESDPAGDEAPPQKPEPSEPQAGEEDEGESSPQAAARPQSFLHLTSAVSSDDEPQDEAEPAGETSNEDGAASEPTAPDPKPDASTPKDAASPQEDEPAEAKPADAGPELPAEGKSGEQGKEPPVAEKPDQPADDEPSDETPADDQPAAAQPAETKPEEPRYEPLEKVADVIRTQLARQRADELVGKQFEELSAEMRRYTDEFDIYTAEKGTNPRAKPPVPLNFAELAKGKDVQPGELESVTAAEAAETPLGKSFRLIEDPRSFRPITVPFTSFAFAETLPTHKYEVVRDNENHVFLFWKTEEEDAYVPSLNDARDKVVQAWKMIKARDLARARAEEYATQARALKKPLQELFGSQAKLEITDTGPFSWLTLGNVPAQPGTPPRLSEVDGVDRPGPDFMKAVFDLPAGGIGVALNEPQTVAYVIRVIEFEPPLGELQDDFARTNPSRYMAAAGDDQRVIYRAWLDDLNKEAGVNWIRQADARRDADPDAAGF